MLKILEDNSVKKAHVLAQRLRVIFTNEKEVKVSQPVKKAEFRICDLDDSVTPAKVTAAVANLGSCDVESIRTGTVRHRSNRTIGSVWVQYPVTAARKVIEAGKILLGWISARVKQCYRCMEFGHIRQECSSDVDRTGRCYTFGELGHCARDCTARSRCSECANSATVRVEQQTPPPTEDEKEERADQGQRPGSTRSPPIIREVEISDSSDTVVCGSEAAVEIE